MQDLQGWELKHFIHSALYLPETYLPLNESFLNENKDATGIQQEMLSLLEPSFFHNVDLSVYLYFPSTFTFHLSFLPFLLPSFILNFP